MRRLPEKQKPAALGARTGFENDLDLGQQDQDDNTTATLFEIQAQRLRERHALSLAMARLIAGLHYTGGAA